MNVSQSAMNNGRAAMAAPTKDDSFVEVVYSEVYRSIGLGLRVERATESGVGAVLVSTTLNAPPVVRALPPYQYRVWMIGPMNVSIMLFKDIEARLNMPSMLYPMTVVLKKCETTFTLFFPPPPQKLNLKIIQHGMGGPDDTSGLSTCKIVDYIKPFKFSGDVPTLTMGHHMLETINGRSLVGLEYIQVVDCIRTATFPLTITVRLEPNQETLNKVRADMDMFNRLQIEACRARFLTCDCSHCATVRTLLGNSSVYTDQVYP
ncbi:Aste57867_15870 [Aphanomyces stellatus]|uniref:Aste57867_15870 protein n=1 Tax=Aphanomyces stellatus TaxID=120398 RepID=A0A485L455_9STRA|nr:hypothetical protein As57867_015814 [Aphanomyces stellatus]VFT92657.1 Aste57867_15870 [Aphanomyces stellatus]